MLINRTPLRVSLLGGGTDLPAFFESNDFGRVLSFAISKYVYISIHPLVEDSRILLKYSKQEFVENYDQLQHPIARAVLRELQIKGVDIGISSDIPSGTGMGSSSAFTVGFYGLCHAFKGTFSSALDLARMACKLEIEELNSPIGKQDQYACALGGINQIDFYPNGSVTAQPLKIEKEVIAEFERHLLLIRVGKTRSASGQLKIQNEILRSRSLSNIEGKYVELRNLVEVGTSVLIKGDFKTLGSLIKQ